MLATVTTTSTVKHNFQCDDYNDEDYIADKVGLDAGDEPAEGCRNDSQCDGDLHCDKASGNCYECVNARNCDDNQYCEENTMSRQTRR